MNSLYQQLNPAPRNNNLINQFLQFKKTFTGNPQQMVQNMLNSGKITQDQLNRYAQQANDIYRQLGRM
jgi:hypothetical protein